MLRLLKRNCFSYKKVFTPESLKPSLLDSKPQQLQSTIDLYNALNRDSFTFSVVSALMTDSPPTQQNLALFSDSGQHAEFTRFLSEIWNHYQKKFISTGAYTDSVGNATVLDGIAQFISSRDSVPTQPKNIFCIESLNVGFENFIISVINDERDAVLLPSPTNDNFEGIVRNNRGTVISYNSVDLSSASSLQEIEALGNKAVEEGITPKILVVVNPGYPSGNLLTAAEIQALIDLAFRQKLLILVDESFQEVVLGPDKFVSFKKVLSEHPDDDVRKSQELISLHSLSHSLMPFNFLGGFAEMVNIDQDVMGQFQKLFSLMLCSSSLEQVATDLFARREEYLSQLSAPIRSVFDKERSSNLEFLRQNFEELKEVLGRSDVIEMNTQNNTFYGMGKITSGRSGPKLAQEIRDEVGIFAKSGDNFGAKNWLVFDKFVRLGEEQKTKLSQVVQRVD